jgi:internalin A
MRLAIGAGEMPEQLSRKTWRRRLRISVRALLVLVLLMGVGLGWIVNGARIQREAVTAIRRDGGVVSYDWDWKYGKWDGWSWQTDGKPGVPKWLLDCLGLDYFDHVVSVSLGQPGSPSALRHIGRLSHVEKLDLHGPFVTDAGLAHLKGLTNLSSLNIGDRYFDCAGTINLLGTARVTDAGMPYLKGLTKLVFLDLDGTKVSDAGLVHLEGMTNLETLRLEDTRVTDAGLVHLEGMTQLKGLELGGTGVTDAGLVHLKTLIGLNALSLRGTRITDAGLAHLEQLTKLSELDLSDTRITDAGLAHLKSLTKLFDLDLRGTQVSPAGATELSLVLPRVHVWLVRENSAPPVVGLEKTSPGGDAGP